MLAGRLAYSLDNKERHPFSIDNAQALPNHPTFYIKDLLDRQSVRTRCSGWRGWTLQWPVKLSRLLGEISCVPGILPEVWKNDKKSGILPYLTKPRKFSGPPTGPFARSTWPRGGRPRPGRQTRRRGPKQSTVTSLNETIGKFPENSR